MTVSNAIGEVFTIENKHIEYSKSYQYPEPHKNAFEAFLWDTFGNDYSDITIHNGVVFFHEPNNGAINYLVVDTCMAEWVSRESRGLGVPPVEIIIGDKDSDSYKHIMLVDSVNVIFPK